MEIFIKNVDIQLLKKQCRTLNKAIRFGKKNGLETDDLDGIWEMCQAIIDKEENS